MRVQPIASISDAGAGLGTAFENKKPVHRQGLLCHSATRGCHHFLSAMGCNLLVYGRLAECVEVRHWKMSMAALAGFPESAIVLGFFGPKLIVPTQRPRS